MISGSSASGDESHEPGKEPAKPFVEALPDDGVCSGACRLLKVVIVGDSGVGKTNLLSRFSKDVFLTDNCSTIGVDMTTKRLRINSSLVKLQLWDSAGQERFRAISSVFYRDVVGALVVYDLTDRKSFDRVDLWLDEIRRYADKHVSIMLVGNKADLQHTRAVSADEAKAKATAHSLLFFETSAFSAMNVEDAFLALAVNSLAELEAAEREAEERQEVEKKEEEERKTHKRKSTFRKKKKKKKKSSSSLSPSGETRSRSGSIKLSAENHSKANCCAGGSHHK